MHWVYVSDKTHMELLRVLSNSASKALSIEATILQLAPHVMASLRVQPAQIALQAIKNTCPSKVAQMGGVLAIGVHEETLELAIICITCNNTGNSMSHRLPIYKGMEHIPRQCSTLHLHPALERCG